MIATSTPPDTIWSQVSEVDFRTHLVTLEERTNAVPVDVLHDQANVDSDSYTDSYLPLHVEKQFADDLAVIAAVTEGAQSVAAVCLEQHVIHNDTALVVRVAGMDVVEDQVKDMLAKVVELLQIVSSHSVSNVEVAADLFVNQIFQLIVQQHKQKLLGRLRSKKWTKPRYLSLTHKKPLWKDFQNVIHRVQHIYPKKSERKERGEVERLLGMLQREYEDFESTEDGEHYEHLQALIKATYSFCRNADICTFAAKLEKVGTTSQTAAALKTLHQLEKIGAYWRFPLSFIETAKQHPTIFKNITLEYLTPYLSVPTTIAYESWAKTCHVHAEIQLTMDYILRKKSLETGHIEGKIIWPRSIGTSKYLCYLCYLFLTYHGVYSMLNTHGRLYDQWTVPDLIECDEGIRAQLARILQQVDKHICTQIDAIKEPIWRAEPMTSRQNLLSSNG